MKRCTGLNLVLNLCRNFEFLIPLYEFVDQIADRAATAGFLLHETRHLPILGIALLLPQAGVCFSGRLEQVIGQRSNREMGRLEIIWEGWVKRG